MKPGGNDPKHKRKGTGKDAPRQFNPGPPPAKAGAAQQRLIIWMQERTVEILGDPEKLFEAACERAGQYLSMLGKMAASNRPAPYGRHAHNARILRTHAKMCR